MILVGAVLLAGVGAYYGYGVYAHSSLDDLNYAVEAPASLPTDAEGEGFVPAGIEVGAVKATVPVGALALAAPEAAEPSAGPSRSALPRQNPISVSSYALIYPGSVMHPKYWGQPLWAGSDPYPTEDGGLPDGFQVVSSPEQEFSQEAAPVASRILIPMIGVDSEVQELQILDLGNSRAYETPDNVVGHIPDTPNPGDAGNGWFFGHLESRLSGEGSVFRRLPEVSNLLRDGESVYVRLVNDGAEYLYQVIDSAIVHQDDLALYGSDDSRITLVTCYPTLYYDYRVLVTAELVGIKS